MAYKVIKPSYAHQLYNKGIYKFNVPPDFKRKFSSYINPDSFEDPNILLPGAYYPDQNDDISKVPSNTRFAGKQKSEMKYGIDNLIKAVQSGFTSVEEWLAAKEQAAQDWRTNERQEGRSGRENWNLFGVSSPTANVKRGRQALEEVWDEGALSEGQEGIGPLLHDASVREREKDDYNIMQSLESDKRFEPSEPPEPKPGFFDKGGALADIMGHKDFGDTMIDFGLGLSQARGGLMNSLTQAAAATQKGYKERKAASTASAMKKAELAVKTHEAMSKRMEAIRKANPNLTYDEALKHVIDLMGGDMGMQGASDEAMEQAHRWAIQLMNPGAITPKTVKSVTAVPTLKK